jgi:hypothetical protein
VLRPFLLVALLLARPASAQSEKEPPYKVPEPAGWAKETFPLPPAFAPDVTWKGVEELRFAPNWMKADADTFFSYAMLFWLSDDPKIETGTLERELLSYYRGLARAVFGARKQKIDVSTFTLAVKRADDDPGKRPDGEPVEAYLGELKWTEPFTTGKPQTLRLEIHTWSAEKQKHRCIFICASPQPETAAVWKTLREIRAGCTFR